MDELGVCPHNAANCSILIVGDRVFAVTSNGQDWTHVNIPSPNSPSFIALDPATGKLTPEAGWTGAVSRIVTTGDRLWAMGPSGLHRWQTNGWTRISTA